MRKVGSTSSRSIYTIQEQDNQSQTSRTTRPSINDSLESLRHRTSTKAPSSSTARTRSSIVDFVSQADTFASNRTTTNVRSEATSRQSGTPSSLVDLVTDKASRVSLSTGSERSRAAAWERYSRMGGPQNRFEGWYERQVNLGKFDYEEHSQSGGTPAPSEPVEKSHSELLSERSSQRRRRRPHLAAQLSSAANSGRGTKSGE